MASQLNGLPFKNIKSASLFLFTSFLQGQTSQSPFFDYKIFTGSNQSPYFYLQGFCRVRSVTLFRFTSFYRVKLISLFDLQCFYRLKRVLLLSTYRDFTEHFQVRSKLSCFLYMLFTNSILTIFTNHRIFSFFTCYTPNTSLHFFYSNF